MIKVLLAIMTFVILCILCINNILMGDCKKNKTTIKKILPYLNFICAGVFGLVYMFIAKMLASNKTFLDAGFSNFGSSGTNEKMGSSSLTYAVYVISMLVGGVSVILMIMSGANSLYCTSDDANDTSIWNWLKLINYVGIGLSGTIFLCVLIKEFHSKKSKTVNSNPSEIEMVNSDPSEPQQVQPNV